MKTKRKYAGIRQLRKITEYNRLGGVCAGLAYYFGVPVWLTRLAAIALIFLTSGLALFAYLILMFILPEWEKTPADFEKITGD